MLYQIYVAINKINDKKYVGQVSKSRGYLKRFKEHIAEAISMRKITYFHNALKYYGESSFEVFLIEDNIDSSVIDERERFWISYFNSNKKELGYNMTIGGQGVHGYVFTDRDRAKMSKNIQKFWDDAKTDVSFMTQRSTRLSQSLKNRQFSENHKKKLSMSASQRTGEKNSFFGKVHSEQTKKLISESNSKAVQMIDKDTNQVLNTFPSLIEACNYLMARGITTNQSASSRISKICRGVGCIAYGYLWKFV
jgi:group I intron endonuclease